MSAANGEEPAADDAPEMRGSANGDAREAVDTDAGEPADESDVESAA
jgi:hypothetical protein